jgi:rod shape-determining protein MreD
VIYKSKFNTNALYAFSFGLYLDIISDSPIGLNAALFLMMAYVVNSYSNTFKLFSSIQICFFFSGASVFYIGFGHLFVNLENFSYLILFTSLIFNTFLFLIIAMLRFYFPFLASR